MLDNPNAMWYNVVKLKQKNQKINRRKMIMNEKVYDFKNKDYDPMQFVRDARRDPEVALWATRRITDSDLMRIFIREWCEVMEEKENE